MHVSVQCGTKTVFVPFRTAVPFWGKLLGIRVRYMFLYRAVLKRYLSRLGAQSRFGHKLLAIRVRYMLLYSAVLTRYLNRLGPQSRLGDELLGIRVRYMFWYSQGQVDV